MFERRNSLNVNGLFTTGAFAKRAGVTVRTHRYYDRMGLLKPHGHTASGQRLYGPAEMVRLQQMLTLKYIGFSLAEIGSILNAPDFNLRAALIAQRATIENKERQMEAVIRAIDLVITTVEGEKPDWEKFAGIIREVQMENMQEFYKKYYTEEQLKAIAERGKNFTAGDHVKVSAEWDDIYKTTKKFADKNADPAGKEARALAKRAQVMIDAFTGGDKGIESVLNKFYADRQNWPTQMQNFVPKLDDKTQQFYDAMMKEYKGKQGKK
jgi:DNA-binding transcriptional MerR regulator